MADLRYVALRPIELGATSYSVGDFVDVSGMTPETIAGLVRSGWLATTAITDAPGLVSVSNGGAIERVATSAYAPRTAIRFPGVAGNYVSTPHHASFDLTENVEMRVRVEGVTSWTHSQHQVLMVRRVGGDFVSRLQVTTAGTLQYQVWIGGDQQIVAVSGPATPFTGWLRGWRRGSDGQMALEYMRDGDSDWTTGDTEVNDTGDMDTASVPLMVGAENEGGSARPCTFTISRAQFRDGVDGNLLADADFRHPVSRHFGDSTGKVWTIHGNDWKFVDGPTPDKSAYLTGETQTSQVIAETVLGSAAAQIQFSSIPSSFRHLLVMLYYAGSAASVVSLRLNGDTGANYDFQRLRANHTTLSGTASVAATSAWVGSTGADTSVGQIVRIMLPGYADTTFEKPFESIATRKGGTALADIYRESFSGFWRNTAAISTVLLFPGAGNFQAGTIATLYGMKGA